ncbi:uncharacterized protein BCR38DRAFT_210474 [Pseudomassariella vexata]|uniref:Uncharacterized protein n=1 Tax=Pseudomassariella vexata TaxID=1141098 RepID=A0A1Y2DYS5_9PEZI|nr:uncharacterized protein BCR38DRAFT_210474 [Pseudomassariella vexata]ORY64256.1 hypothetical protein BCR38DRAFT_210474 [Pseudomassariella vexata]
MAEKSSINRSIEVIRKELEILQKAGALRWEQLNSITAQLPAPGGQPSAYVDARYAPGGTGKNAVVSPALPQTIAQQAQDPNHPANPNHRKHEEWAKDLAAKFGNAFVFGSGATLGADMVNSVWNNI